MLRSALLLASLFMVLPALARVGFGDPEAAWRDREPGRHLVASGQLRLRAASYFNLDLDRPPEAALWLPGEGPLDQTAGADLRLRLGVSLFAGELVRIVTEVDLADANLGARPRGTPFGEGSALVVATPFQEALTRAGIRKAYGEVRLPIGLLAAGRMPAHFGLGIAANAGDAIDDDGGDLADRIAYVAPLFGHYVGLAYDVAASGAVSRGLGAAPAAGLPSTSVQVVSLSVVRYHAPWQLGLYRRAGRSLLNYGLAVSHAWQARDVPTYWQSLDPELAGRPELVIERGAAATLLDSWLRLVWGSFRIEFEGVVGYFLIENPSPWPGVTVRTPVEGTPAGAVLQLAYEPLRARFDWLLEAGVASADPAPGFPLPSPTAFVEARPGALFGPQIDGPRDPRMDAFRFSPNYRVDLILWRTLLGGVSEATYLRSRFRFRPGRDLVFSASAIYSHGLSAASNPGGVRPLGFEVDVGAELRAGGFHLRLDLGGLWPLGGLGVRGGRAPTFAHMLLLRLGYAV
ncbi:MAG: hypothetical protein D6729_17680 [Deltaproteobacteria bacterium]|nr:MAG: hypothetical protein D6729_17680 [Deltaproteobacteria bacterium]